MRRINRDLSSFGPIIVPGAALDARDPISLRGIFSGRASGCMRCPDTPCISFVAASVHQTPVCPTDAIHMAGPDGSAVIGLDCIGCGICAVLCPVGAISYSSPDGPISHPASEVVGAIAATPQQFSNWLADAVPADSLAHLNRGVLIEHCMTAAAGLRGHQFYPLVERLFRAIGIPAVVSNQGDTSNRIDMKLPHPLLAIPVEIKSFTEVPTINDKSVQQALENKLAITRLEGLDELTEASSLVVGYAYPTSRTRIDELIEDVEGTFGIRIGLISLRRLYELFLEVVVDGTPFDRSRLETLKGQL